MKDYKIPESVERILDSYDVTATIDEDCIEVEGRTEHDGDMIHHLYVKQDEFNDLYAWYKAWHDMCEDFDPWYETSLWCENGVPVRTPFDKANDLYNDINDYKGSILEGIDNDLYALAKENNREKAKCLSEFKDYELYAELRRRGHYDVFEVNVNDLASYTDVCVWAGETRKVDSLMEAWAEKLIDYMDPGDQVSDMLYEAADELGYGDAINE
jgi:hypothetical protein